MNVCVKYLCVVLVPLPSKCYWSPSLWTEHKRYVKPTVKPQAKCSLVYRYCLQRTRISLRRTTYSYKYTTEGSCFCHTGSVTNTLKSISTYICKAALTTCSYFCQRIFFLLLGTQHEERFVPGQYNSSTSCRSCGQKTGNDRYSRHTVLPCFRLYPNISQCFTDLL